MTFLALYAFMCAITSILYYIQSSLWLPYANKAHCIVLYSSHSF